jgi:hypothetical protein
MPRKGGKSLDDNYRAMTQDALTGIEIVTAYQGNTTYTGRRDKLILKK